jgi:hypothetical protein
MNQRTRELIDCLIGSAYDTGFYSGQREDGQPHHVEAIRKRTQIKAELIVAIEDEIKAAVPEEVQAGKSYAEYFHGVKPHGDYNAKGG